MSEKNSLDDWCGFPVLPPNRPDGSYTINCGRDDDYPEGTQINCIIHRGAILAVEPRPMTEDGRAQSGCTIHLVGGHAVFVECEVTEVLEAITGDCDSQRVE